MPSVAANPACRPCPKLRTARYAMLGPGVTSITRPCFLAQLTLTPLPHCKLGWNYTEYTKCTRQNLSDGLS